MTFQGRRTRARQEGFEASGGDQEPRSGEVLPAAPDKAADGIPAHVWSMLQDAGEEAAARLLELLQSPRFKQFKPSEQRGLIELAMVRAYGLPVRRSVSIDLSSSDVDAVAASLAGLTDALPERRGGNDTGNG